MIGGRDLCLEDFKQIIFHRATLELDPDALAAVGQSFDFLQEFSREKIIYGINTDPPSPMGPKPRELMAS